MTAGQADTIHGIPMNMLLLKPSRAVKAILKTYCQKKREQLGDNWKKIESKRLADETTKQIMPLVKALQRLRKTNDGGL